MDAFNRGNVNPNITGMSNPERNNNSTLQSGGRMPNNNDRPSNYRVETGTIGNKPDTFNGDSSNVNINNNNTSANNTLSSNIPTVNSGMTNNVIGGTSRNNSMSSNAKPPMPTGTPPWWIPGMDKIWVPGWSDFELKVL